MKNVQLSPRLRFREFTEPWNKSKLGHLVHIQSGETPSKFKILTAGRYPFIKVDDLNNSERVQLTGRAYINESKSPIPKDSIIFPKRGGAIMTNKVRIAGCEMQMDTNMMALYPIDDSIKSDFLYYLISKANLSKIADTSSIPQINNKHIEPYRVAIPIPKEQQKIAAFLTSVDTKIQQLTKKKVLLEQYKKGVMQKIFKQEIRFKDEKGRDYPEWEERTLGELGTTYNGLTGKSKEDFGTGVPFITYKQIFDSSRIDTSKFEFVRVAENENQSKAKVGDIFFTTSSETAHEIGFASVLLDHVDNLHLNSFCFGYRPNSLEQIHPEYSRFYFRSSQFRMLILKLAQGSTRYNMSKVGLMEIRISLPCHKEQKAISAFLTAIESKIDDVSKQIELTRIFKKGLLQQMFV